MPTPSDRARYVMIGGFLGAGKTTAIARIGKLLTDRGLRVGLITNDQSHGLVDTAFLRSRGFDVEEITGGCFCCRFPSLREAAAKLSAATRPDVFLAEPVGSCTDLVATVSYPLRRIYGEDFDVAPLSVMVDPARAARILGVVEGKPFSKKVVYVYEKQLEEASVLVVNKCDTLEAESRTRLVEALRERYPKKDVLCCAAETGEGVEAWVDHVWTRSFVEAPTMAIDYDTYAEGEALLGWLNATLRLEADEPLDGDQLLVDLAARIAAEVAASGGEVAHLKMTLDPGDPLGRLAVVSTVRNDQAPMLREALADPVIAGQVVLNLRAEAGPDRLLEIVRDAVARGAKPEGTTAQAKLHLEHEEHFRPARPTPTHRITV